MSIDWEEDVQILLEDEEGQEHEFILIKKFLLDSEEYVVLQPMDEDEQIIFKFAKDDDGDEFLSYIEDEEEFGIVSEAFGMLFAEDDLDFIDDEFEDEFEYDEDEDEDGE